MHKRLYTSLTAVTALVLSAVLMVPAFGAVKEQAVDTILLEPETLWEDEVPVDRRDGHCRRFQKPDPGDQ